MFPIVRPPEAGRIRHSLHGAFYIALLVVAGSSACSGGGSPSGPSTESSSRWAGTYAARTVDGAPLGTPFVVGCGAPDTGFYNGTASVTSGSLRLVGRDDARAGETAGEYFLTCAITSNCGFGIFTNESVSRGTWDADNTGVQLYPRGDAAECRAYQTTTQSEGSLAVVVGLPTNQGPIRKTFVFVKP